MDVGIDNLLGPDIPQNGDVSYQSAIAARVKLGDYVDPYSSEQVYKLPDVGNKPSFLYILRKETWQGGGN
jgi:hypothetical protein